MRTIVLPIQERLGIGQRSALVVAAAALTVVGAGIALSARLELLAQVIALLVALLALLASLRWPLLPLFVLAILIPVEEAIVLGWLGTLSRFAALLFVISYGLPRLGRLTITAMPPAGWAYVGWAVLSVGWAIDPSVTLNELPTLSLLFTTSVLVASAVAERPTIVRPVLWVYTLSAAVTAVIGISEYLQGGYSTAARVAALPGQDPAHYAALLLPALVFSLHEFLHGRLIALAGPVAMVCTAGVILSGTRGAWLSAAVVASVYIVIRLSPARRLVAVALMAGLVGLGLQLPGAAEFVAERSDTALSSGGAGRTDIWLVGLHIYGSAPVVGVGLANFPVAYSPERMREANVTTFVPWRPANRSPHSIVIGTLGELGTIGLILLALFLVPLLVRTGWGPDAAAVQAMLASLVATALFLDLLNRKQVWLVLGIACGLAYLARTLPTAAATDGATVPQGAGSLAARYQVQVGGRATVGHSGEPDNLSVDGGTDASSGFGRVSERASRTEASPSSSGFGGRKHGPET